jgi:hypothetical protein
MERDFILTQTKEVVMTMDKTVTVMTEKLETVDIFGKKHIKAFNRTESVDYYSIGSGEWRAA